jgi:short-chain fatty acids transporter
MADSAHPLDRLRDLGAGLSRLTERLVPDPWVICMGLTAAALALAIAGAGASPHEALLAWGNGVWSLLTLAMQFTIAMVAAQACVVSRPVYRVLDRLAALPDPEKPMQAVLLAWLFSLVTAYLNWAVCWSRARCSCPSSCDATRARTCACWWRRPISGPAPYGTAACPARRR